MGVKIRKRGGKWYVFVNYHGRRKAKCVGTSRQLAEEVRRQLEAKLALGDLRFLAEADGPLPSFQGYAEKWLNQTAEIQCKPSTVAGYRRILKLRLFPRFGSLPLKQITRDEVKKFLSELAASELSRNTLRNTLCTIRVILNHAIEDGLIDRNPASRLGRFTKSEKAVFQATALTREECQRFLQAAHEISPEYYPLFLAALRAGLRRGELVALKWGDIQFGASEEDSNRYILVQHNYVCGRFTTPKSKRSFSRETFTTRCKFTSRSGQPVVARQKAISRAFEHRRMLRGEAQPSSQATRIGLSPGWTGLIHRSIPKLTAFVLTRASRS